MTLEWRQLPTKEICHVSACGRYSVALDELHGIWRVYKLAPGGPWFAYIDHRPNEQAAKERADEHAASQRG